MRFFYHLSDEIVHDISLSNLSGDGYDCKLKSDFLLYAKITLLTQEMLLDQNSAHGYRVLLESKLILLFYCRIEIL